MKVTFEFGGFILLQTHLIMPKGGVSRGMPPCGFILIPFEDVAGVDFGLDVI